MRSSVQATLPVDRYLDDLVALVRKEKRAVVIAPPGAGKTTRIPPALTALGPTILLQPRRVAARTLARRIAEERQWSIGREIGWQIRFERRFSAETRLLVATEGILTARLQADPLLSDFSVVILDEFHERSIHADLALALVRQAAEVRDDLAIVVMSATIDAEPVARFIGARIVEIEARRYPVDIRHAPELSMAEAVRETLRTSSGHLLCFLPGVREIEAARRELTGIANVLPLHGSLDLEAQERALLPSQERKVILATNVAETSLTVDGVTGVIDSGLQKVLRFDPETGVDHLESEWISRDSADQRAGRAGRTAPGRAIRLWDERMMLRPHREPEVQRVDLAAPVLDIIAWGGDPTTFEWFEQPPLYRIEGALDLLERLGAAKQRKLTPMGKTLRRFSLHPRLARVLVEASGSAAAARVCALLSEDLRKSGSGDALVLADSPRLDFAARELTSMARRILGNPPDASESEDLRTRRALLAGYPDRVAMRREPGSSRLLLASGTGAALARGTDFSAGDFLLALDVSGGEEALVRVAVPIERDWLTPTHRDVVHEDLGTRVRATERVWYGAILLREVNVPPDPEEVRRLTAARLRTSIDPQLERRLSAAGIEVDWTDLIETTGSTQLPWHLQRDLEKRAPARLDLPSGRTTALDYREDGSIVASVKLQELFGLAETPQIGPGRTPVTFALLSPAGRPVQVTRDLRSFWTTGYQEVRKELRARYPKHPWPEDPWTAEPTHRTKRR